MKTGSFWNKVFMRGLTKMGKTNTIIMALHLAIVAVAVLVEMVTLEQLFLFFKHLWIAPLLCKESILH